MDIRKFFGPQATPKIANQTSKSSRDTKQTVAKVDESKKKDTGKKQKAKSSTKAQGKKTASPSKKLTLDKNFENDTEDSVVVEDFSDEEVIKSSLGSKQNGHKSTTSKPGKEKSAPKTKKSKDSPAAQGAEGKSGSKKKAALVSEEVIDIDSIPSSGSSTTKSKQDTQASTPKKRSPESSSIPTKDAPGSKKKCEKKEIPLRRSPRKQNSTNKEEKETNKRVLHEKELEEESPKKTKRKAYSFNSEDSDTEEVLATRRNRNGKSTRKLSKRVSRVLDSDSDEDPLQDLKSKPKRKKKEAAASCIADSDEEEKKTTAMDKFVIHNPKTPSKDTSKKTSSIESTPKEKPVSVADFFGAGSAERSTRKTAVAKRKHGDIDTEATDKGDTPVDLTFDEEMHDDEDFMKTLDQIDGPSLKKVKPEDNVQDASASSPKDKQQTGSLASKLSGKMKQTSCDNSSCDIKGGENSKATRKSPLGKTQANGKPSPKKGKVYTMEVTRTKPPPIIISPGKSKKAEEITPVKPAPKKAKSEQKPTDGDDDNDDGFGGTKGIKGFQAFKARGGPLALGSKEIPEGAENCMEGMTFVVTGVLDSIDRDDAKSLIERHGGKVTGNVSGRTSYLVVGRDPGESKIKKATQLKLKQVDEDGLFDLIKTLPGKTSKYELQAREQMKKEASLKAEKEKEELKRTESAKKLESFRSSKDSRNTSAPASTPSPKKQRSLFTQLKDSSDKSASTSSAISSSTTAPSPASAAKLLSQSQSPSQKGLGPKSEVKAASVGSEEPQSLLWVDKHKPTSLKQIIGQQGDKSNARKLLNWMKAWHQNVIVKGLKPSGNFFNKGDGAGCRAALLSGPPGIGKTTTATLVCEELGFSYVELNASDTRSKRSLKEVVAESLDNNTLVDYTNESRGPSGQSHCLIMDEVDGMAGNEDRGGLQELVQLIKKSKIPILCICNDRNSMKMRTLSNYCLDLRFQRPRVEQIKGAMMSLAFKEGLKIPPAALNEIILASNHDIRQVIHNMSMWSAGDKTMTFEQVKSDAQKAQKDIKLGPFDVCRKVFVSDDETRKMSINDKSDLFFNDYSFGPLFVHENYVKVIPSIAGGNHARHLSCLARTIDSICDGDLVDKLVRREGNWNLLPTQAMYSSVIPGEVMRGSFPQMTDFPQWLGKFSSTNKTQRILQELSTHMRLEVSCDKRGLTLDYLPSFRKSLTQPLVSQGAEGVPEVIKVMDDYDIVKEDFDNIMEVTKWPKGFDPMAQLDSKTKAAFTRQYNKQIHLTPYATGAAGGRKRKARGAPMEEEGTLLLEEEGEGVTPQSDEEGEEEEGIEADTMIKSKKPAAAKGKGGDGGSQSGSKGKGKGKGSKK